MKIHGRSTILFVALTLTPPAAGLVLAGCGKTIARQTRAGTDDLSITTRVKTALLNDPNVGAQQIDVNASDGVVTLTGVVKSQAEVDRAVELARKIGGVKDVKTTLEVKP